MSSRKEMTFEIRLKGNIATIATDRTRIGTLEILIKMILSEYYRKSPDELDKFMIRLNMLHQITTGKVTEAEGEPINDFEFWKGLMERRETELNGGG